MKKQRQRSLWETDMQCYGSFAMVYILVPHQKVNWTTRYFPVHTEQSGGLAKFCSLLWVCLSNEPNLFNKPFWSKVALHQELLTEKTRQKVKKNPRSSSDDAGQPTTCASLGCVYLQCQAVSYASCLWFTWGGARPAFLGGSVLTWWSWTELDCPFTPLQRNWTIGANDLARLVETGLVWTLRHTWSPDIKPPSVAPARTLLKSSRFKETH